MNGTNAFGSWSDKKVLLTGCSGFLGSWLAHGLVELGASVTGLVRDMVPKSNINTMGLTGRVNIVRGDIEDLALMERVVNEYEIDTVFHLAAQAIVGTANRNPVSTFETNIRGTWNVLEACRRAGTVKRVLVASSDKAYGSHGTLPYTEDFALQGRYPYDASKSCTDIIAQTYHSTYGLPVCITRCGNFFGGGDLNFNRIIPGTVKSVLENRPPVIRSDGTFIRDYIYVRDVVSAYIFLAEKMDRQDVIGQAFNFSNEVQLTVLELTEKILDLMQRKDLRPVILNEAKGEIKHQYLSAEKARTLLGWKPKYTIDAALKETIDWYRDFFEKGGAEDEPNASRKEAFS